MSDPLDVLREPIVAIDPDVYFAAALRLRLQQAVLTPVEHPRPNRRGALMTDVPTSKAEVTDPAELAWGPALAPYLLVEDTREALAWYVEIFDAERRGQLYVMPDGRIGHAELGIGDAVLMLADGAPPARTPGVMPPHTIFVSVPDADATVARAISAGAELERAVGDQGYGRTGVIVDPFGHRWMVNTMPARASRARPGDLVYVTIWARDQERAAAFYDAVLGSRVSEMLTQPTVSIAPLDHPRADPDEQPGTVPVFLVVSVADAISAVRVGGGRANEAEHERFGTIADCYDPEGTHFAVWQPPGD